MNFIDGILNSITMYRLIVYYLIFIILVSFVLALLGFVSINPLSILLSSIFLIAICFITNKVFSKLLNAPTNTESFLISALILSLILTPAESPEGFMLLTISGILAMASKYILALHKKHIFNPAAIAVVITAFTINGSASWWVGNTALFPFLLLGFLIVKKIRRFGMVSCFILVSFLINAFLIVSAGQDLILFSKNFFLDSPLLFFSIIMLTEPLTSPTTKTLQITYGGIIGILYSLPFNFGSFYMTPEIALVLGNIFSYLVNSKEKLFLKVDETKKIGKDIYEFNFPLRKNLNFIPGQYMEWTLSHRNTDSRGNRRYFTIASSPTEDSLKIGVKIYPDGSSFKKSLLEKEDKKAIVAAQLGGSFILPKDKNKKLVFIAGGIGVTPFRSIVKYLVDKGEKRDITIFYSNRNVEEIVYKDIFDEAEKLNIKTFYNLTDLQNIPENWQGEKGRITGDLIKENVKDHKERIFYISGPQEMVDGFKKIIKELGVKNYNIKTDYFPGY